MINLKQFLLLGLLFLAAIYICQAAETQQQHNHQQHEQQQQPNKNLQCWHCSSDTIGAEDFCGTAFKESNIPTDMMKERNISIVRSCNSTINSEHERAVCRKTVEESNGKVIIKRFCYYTNKSDPLDHCSREITEKSIRRIFCQDCLTDKCNSAARVVTMLGTMLMPLLFAKVLAE